ncbi:hypothetical protein R3P38DRAFT_2768990 [Favolaschia claudopus]|uniref:Uncharacterized protein n=1 Tax=Favolaschia claudopus TaxID=2862362 RepID=A0AAW0CQ10_9AGAR
MITPPPTYFTVRKFISDLADENSVWVNIVPCLPTPPLQGCGPSQVFVLGTRNTEHGFAHRPPISDMESDVVVSRVPRTISTRVPIQRSSSFMNQEMQHEESPSMVIEGGATISSARDCLGFRSSECTASKWRGKKRLSVYVNDTAVVGLEMRRAVACVKNDERDEGDFERRGGLKEWNGKRKRQRKRVGPKQQQNWCTTPLTNTRQQANEAWCKYAYDT